MPNKVVALLIIRYSDVFNLLSTIVGYHEQSLVGQFVIIGAGLCLIWGLRDRRRAFNGELGVHVDAD